MNTTTLRISLPRMLRVGLAALLVGLGAPAHALINGWMGEDPSAANGNARTFSLTAKHHFVSTADGNSHYAWGYAHTGLPMQYPGPTLIVNQGDTVKVVLNNTLPVPVSIIFPGQQDVTASGGNPGLLTREARAVPITENAVAGGPTYTFVASQAGTFQYHSGTSADVQVEMGLVGALIVRPPVYALGAPNSHPNRKAYPNPGTEYDRETLFLLSEMDPELHKDVYAQVFSGLPVRVDTTKIHPSIWFINGRNAPDTLLEEFVGWLPTQPYNALPRMHAGEKLLMRVVNAGRDLHPFHHHGNHATPIARDARVLASVPGGAPDLSSPDFTVRSVPGQTMDLIFEWTGKGIGWDIYGSAAINPHLCNGLSVPSAGFDPVTKEWCPDHYKPIPVIIPGPLDLSFGETYGGSPYLGLLGSLPQGHPGSNTTGGYFHMWHSHNEREITNDDIFPGGMMTMLVIEPRSIDLEAGQPLAGAGGALQPAVTITSVSFDVGTTLASASFSGANIDFGAQSGIRTATVTLLVSNAPNTFGAGTVLNFPSGSRFTLGTNTCSGASFLPGASCTVQINFDASGSGTVWMGSLTVPHVSGAAALSLSGQ
jgi:manganese oxidase